MEVTRAAMVCAVRCESAVVHWIEIELRRKESGYRSLLFTADDSSISQVTLDLLKIAALCSCRHRRDWACTRRLMLPWMVPVPSS